jgi:ATP-dependent protease HslVU (ClpYQ) ATPase subunit
MSTLLEEILFDVPEVHFDDIIIDKKKVEEMLKSVVEDEDLTRYIL